MDPQHYIRVRQCHATYLTGNMAILLYLLLEGVNAREGFLITHTFEKVQLSTLSVEVDSLNAEEVGFEDRRVTPKSGTDPDICSCGIHAFVYSHQTGIHSKPRYNPPGKADINGRKSYQAAPFITVHHPPLHTKGSPQQYSSISDLTLSDLFPNTARTDLAFSVRACRGFNT
jgi:hypothetical protein